jgi:transcriptional regulator with XRE-family HTH domain
LCNNERFKLVFTRAPIAKTNRCETENPFRREAAQSASFPLLEKANVSLNFLSIVERGVRAPLSFDNLKRLAKVLRVPVHELFQPQEQ